MPDPQIGPERPQHPGHQGQVVVLHQDGSALGGLVGERLGERAVVGLVRLPLGAELRSEGRFQRRLVEHVVDKPEGGVRDAVVRGRVHLGRDPQHPHLLSGRVRRVEASTGAAHRLPVAVAQRGAHPHGVRVGPDRGQAGHQAAAAAAGLQRAVCAVVQRVRNGAAIGRDQDLCGLLGNHVPKPSRSGKRSNARPGVCLGSPLGRETLSGLLGRRRQGRPQAIARPRMGRPGVLGASWSGTATRGQRRTGRRTGGDSLPSAGKPADRR